jgi:lysophospholipase L1-like esterase
MRILIFGDSIAQGFWDETGGWVDKLKRHYGSKQAGDAGLDKPTVFNLGISGDTSSSVVKRVELETIARTWDNQKPIVLIQIGTNDSRLQNNKPQHTIEQYQDNLRQITEKLTDITVETVFVGLSCCDETKTSPVHWEESYWNNTDLKRYENAMRETARELSLPFIPLFDDFSKAFAINPSILPDGLHPDKQGHQIIYAIIKPKLDIILSRN